VQIRHGPAAVSRSAAAYGHWAIPREDAAARWFGVRRPACSEVTVTTCERQGGDSYTAVLSCHSYASASLGRGFFYITRRGYVWRGGKDEIL